MTDAPVVTDIKRVNGVADQVGYTATVTYEGEDPSLVTFTGSVHGGPIVMVTPGNPRGVFVSNRVTERIGSTLSPEWVRQFFAPREP